MAKSFTNLKSPLLGLSDLIPLGKLKDCRVCDVIQDHADYLNWLQTNGYIKFQQIVKETIQETIMVANQAVNDEDDRAYMEDQYQPLLEFEDVPF